MARQYPTREFISRGVNGMESGMTEDDLTGTASRKVANRIIATREAMDMDQATFARHCGLTPQAINNYETAFRRPSVDSAGKIAAATGTSTDWIYRGERAHLPHKLMIRIFPPKRSTG